MDKQCSNCALYIAEQNGCLRTKTIEEPTNYCGHWTTKVSLCAACGQYFILPVSYMLDGEEVRPICPTCFNNRNRCKTCTCSGYCDFKENPINIPPTIQQTVQRGNALMTVQTMNPERIKATCMTNCKCWCEEGCNREFGTCGNYEFILDKKEVTINE